MKTVQRRDKNDISKITHIRQGNKFIPMAAYYKKLERAAQRREARQ